MAVLEGLDVDHACPVCGRYFATSRGLWVHRGHSHRPPREPLPASARAPGWRIEAGSRGDWLWSLAWRPPGRLDGVPAALRFDVTRRCWLAGIALTDPDTVLAVAVSTLEAKGIEVAGVDGLVPPPPPPPPPEPLPPEPAPPPPARRPEPPPLCALCARATAAMRAVNGQSGSRSKRENGRARSVY